MKIAVVICNIILFGFTLLVLVSEGLSRESIYIIFTIWALLTMILSTVVISLAGAANGWFGLKGNIKISGKQDKVNDMYSAGKITKIVTIICNVIFLGFICWALVDQYPHPKEQGVIAFSILMVLTPILNLIVLKNAIVRNIQKS